VLVVGCAILASFAIATPYGPDTVTRVSDQRANWSDISSKAVSAQGGNTTQLTINASTWTKRWQGYYGNITGYVTLDDAIGNTMYDWGQSNGLSLVGEIYAANKSVTDWSQIKCINVSPEGKGWNCTGQEEGCLNLTSIEAAFNISSTDVDGVNETFTGTVDINVGTITLDNCPATYIYQNNASVAGTWNQTLLTINNTNDTLIFASQVEQDTTGFNGFPWDFEMIVLDNGNIVAPTTYNFYVELT